MLAILGIAVLLWLGRIASGLVVKTWYASGFDEGRFYQLSRGMDAADVEAFAGPPIVKTPWGEDSELWQYSGRSGILYHRHWVIMTKGKVSDVVSDISGF